ncbi:tRNA (adenosine(37)-N6)-threonylcarbamoyltransferase complex ATPase subunit type 1 TsaE [Candidatus Saccharibacteria bacterium]|nr:tRNA (adenosine(37)-N6)-threonylcarbamoyltransferase complex ATPase subunit type 1 TsaE [Candidatus Saccharibacteria bacterium]
MNTDMKLKINSTDSSYTEKIGEQIGAKLKGGELIELASDLGGGKTTFTRGLARGAGSRDIVSSPTFTISNVYEGSGLTINHFDFYRLSQPGLIVNELSELINDRTQVIIVEWAGLVENILPKNRLVVEILHSSENSRIISITFTQKLKYLVEGLK